MRIAIAAVLVGAALLLAILLAVGALVPGPTPSASPAIGTASAQPSVTPEPSLTPRPSVTPEPSSTARPSLTPGPSVTPDPTATGDDPADLPRFPGAKLEDRHLGRDGDLATLELEYRTPARLDRVRRHYRVMLRRHDWFVGDVEFDDDTWAIAANKGSREASIELKRDGGGTEVEIDISWPADDRGSRSGGPNDDHSGPGR